MERPAAGRTFWTSASAQFNEGGRWGALYRPRWLIPSGPPEGTCLPCLVHSSCKLSIVTAEIYSPVLPFLICPKWHMCPILSHCLWNFHAYMNSSCARIKIWLSPMNLTLLIWLLAQLEELGKWEKRKFFKSPHLFRASPVPPAWEAEGKQGLSTQRSPQLHLTVHRECRSFPEVFCTLPSNCTPLSSQSVLNTVCAYIFRFYLLNSFTEIPVWVMADSPA